MWQKIRFLFSYQRKKLEIRLGTWRNHRAIAKAYSGPPPPLFTKRRIRTAALALGVCVAVAGVVLVTPHLMRVAGGVAHRLTEVKIHAPARDTGIARAPVVTPAPAASPAPAAAPAPPLIPAPPPAPAGAPPDIAAREMLKRAWVPSAQMQYVLVANKATAQMFLIEASQRRLLASYSMATGAKQGPKESAGDKKTPEGIYFIVGRKERNEIDKIYGPLSYVLNYPNEEDRRAGRTGQGIWIHGTAPDSVPLFTRGCLELRNSDLVSLASYLRMGIGTPVVIVNAPSLGDPAALPDYAALAIRRQAIVADHRAKSAEFYRLLDEWRAAWESKDIDSYSRFYAAALFSSQGQSWEIWRARKQAIFEQYQTIAVSLDRIVVSDVTDSTAVVKFMQTYAATNRSRTQSAKRLLLKKVDGQWLIFQEATLATEELAL